MVFAPSANRQVRRQAHRARHDRWRAGFPTIPPGLKRALAEPINTVQDTGKRLDGRQQATRRGRRPRRGHPRSRDAEERPVRAPRRRRVAARPSAACWATRRTREQLSPGHEAAARHARQHESHVHRRPTRRCSEFTERSGPDGKTPVERMVGTIEMTERTLRKFSEPPGERRAGPRRPDRQRPWRTSAKSPR